MIRQPLSFSTFQLQHFFAQAATCVALVAAVWACQGFARQAKPNLILILADDLGYGDLGCFGQKTLKTPRLDQMAAEGMKFTQFYAGATVCAPSRCVLLTGKHGGRATVRGNSTNPIVIRPEEPTLASVLRKAGYRSACVGKWGVGTPDDFTNPNDVGFDHFYGYVNMWHAHNFYPEFLIRNGKVEKLQNAVAPKWKPWQNPKHPMSGRGVAVIKKQYAPDLFIEDALSFIRDNAQGANADEKNNPFFLYFAMNVPHANNEAGAQGMEVPDLGEFAHKDWPEPEKGFAAMIRNIDRDVGRILDLLQELKLDQNTLVLFTSDNGPHWEGGHNADYFDSNGQFRGYKRDLYEGGIRVPTIARWPGVVKPGSEDDAHWYFGDFLATFAELGQAKLPEGLDSDSFAGPLRGTAHEKRWGRKNKMYWEFYERGTAQAVRFGKWKAIRKPMFTGEIQLYDMSNDPDESSDYAKRRPDLSRHAANLFDKYHRPDPNWKTRAPNKRVE